MVLNKELQFLYEQDQADRRSLKAQALTPEQRNHMIQQDRVRLQRVEELVRSGALQVAEDYFYAAMIFQHGETLEHYWQAYELAKRGAELGYPPCRWLTAAAYDRWLMKQKKPQKYGTQYVFLKERGWILYEVDPTTTDAQRDEWNVPPLAQALRQAENLNRIVSAPSE